MANPNTKKRILIVDDEVDLVDMIKFQLEAQNYEVFTAYNGVEALEQLDQIMPDLIVLDINMPKMSGLEFCNKISTSYGTLRYPVLILTARAHLEGVFKDVPVEGFVIKPFEIDEFISRIADIVTGKTRKVVFVMDFKENAHVRDIVVLLQRQRYHVVTVEDLKTVQQQLEDTVPEIVFLEYMQKGISGDEVVQQLRQMEPLQDTLIIVYSYSGFEDYKEKSIAAGADVYMGKPDNEQAFLAAIKEAQFRRGEGNR